MAITLVLWTTIGLSSLLYSLLESYQYLLMNISIARQNATARSAALFCRDIVLGEFIRDADYRPLINKYVDIPVDNISFSNTKCSVTNFVSSIEKSFDGNNISINNEIITIGKHTSKHISGDGFYKSDKSVAMKTKFSISNDIDEPFRFLYTVEI